MDNLDYYAVELVVSGSPALIQELSERIPKREITSVQIEGSGRTTIELDAYASDASLAILSARSALWSLLSYHQASITEVRATKKHEPFLP